MESGPVRSRKGSARFTTFLFLVLVGLPAILVAREPGETRSIDGVWTSRADDATRVRAIHGRLPLAFRVAAVDEHALDERLAAAPLERITPIGPGRFAAMAQPGAILELPLPDGRFARVEIGESPIFSPVLQRRHPGIRTYRGVGVDDATLTARLDKTPAGFHGQLISSEGSVYIDPVSGDAPGLYISYWKRDLVRDPFRCDTTGRVVNPPDEDLREKRGVAPLASGNELRTYRTAISATGEYTTFWGGTAGAAAQIATTINRVTGIYERDVAIRFNVTGTNIRTDPATDNFTNGNIDSLLAENQTQLDAVVGAANYDIGHLLSQGGSGGKAGLGVTCGGSKARGATSQGNPSGDAFDIDYVAHEMGHQMGGDHTFDGTSSANCSGNRVGSSAYEPGSGTTVMAYAGICDDDNVQANSDDYFHTRSYDQIRAYQGGGGACGTVTLTGNGIPSVNAGADFTIPRSTPFRLTASGSDPNPDSLTFTWEQYDLGPGEPGPPESTDDGPLFRSRAGTTSPTRVMPRFADLLAGAATPWDVLAGKDRDLNFRATVRDNRLNGGGSDHDAMVVHVSGAPFQITSPATNANAECGTPLSILWNKGGSSEADVRALISTSGGVSFSTLIGSTPNDGSATVNAPQTVTGNARLELQGVGNIYFALSGAFRIRDTLNPTVNPPAALPAVQCTQCSPQGASPAIGTATANDACDTTLTISSDQPSVFPLGTTLVTWSARDDSLNTGTAGQNVTVVDTTPPSLTAPPSVTVECTGASGTPVSLGSATVNDVCWCTVNVTNDAPSAFSLGTTTVTWTAVDGSSNMTQQTQTVTVVDTTPPELSVSVSPPVLWPPSHQMIQIDATIVATDICDAAPTVRLVSITSNEPDNGLGDGDTAGDVQGAAIGTDDRSFLLRAERGGLGAGRNYTIVYEAVDGSGNTTVEQVVVSVPHSRRRGV
jgi:hypothetical protein